jgi:hypothetical protein
MVSFCRVDHGTVSSRKTVTANCVRLRAAASEVGEQGFQSIGPEM